MNKHISLQLGIYIALTVFFYCNVSRADWNIRISDSIVEEQVSDVILFTLGNQTQVIVANTEHPQGYVDFSCPQGQWPYEIQATTTINYLGRPIEIHGGSAGLLNCTGNGTFEVVADYSRNPAVVTLQNAQSQLQEAQTPPPNSHDVTAAAKRLQDRTFTQGVMNDQWRNFNNNFSKRW